MLTEVKIPEGFTVTRKEAHKAINTAYALWREGQEADISNDTLAQIVVGVVADFQVRDYLLGVPSEGYAVADYADFLEILTLAIPNEYKYPFFTVQSAFAYEMGNTPKAHEFLNLAKSISPDYSLASLLTRVFGAGWPQGAFAAMRDDLHSKVLHEINTDGDNPVALSD